MPARESKSKTVPFTTLAGVNERLLATELPAKDFSIVEGLFPEFAGLQSRLFGKRTLAKYANPIYGIHQFWTPRGYGVGLYQFAGTVDAGNWTTPTSVFSVPALAPTLGIDGAGNTVNEFGFSGGSAFDVTPPPVVWTPVDTPNDSNGGPAGQGRHCQWVNSTQAVAVESFLTFAQYGDTGLIDVVTVIPGPEVVSLGPVPSVSSYTDYPTGPFAGYLITYKANASYWVASLGVYYAHRSRRAKNGKVTFSFASVQADESVVGVSLDIRQHLQDGGGAPPTIEYSLEVPLPFVRDANGVVADYVIDMNNYLIFSQAPRVLLDGYSMISDVDVVGVILHRRNRVCS